MKKLLFSFALLISLVLIVTGCSVNEPPDISGFQGVWKIYIGNEYSPITKYSELRFIDTVFYYDSVQFSLVETRKNKLYAINDADNTIYKLELTLTYNENNFIGYEHHIAGTHIDTIYVFGEKVSDIIVDSYD